MGLLKCVLVLVLFLGVFAGAAAAFGVLGVVILYFPWPGIPIGLGALAVYLAGALIWDRYVWPLVARL